MQGLINITEENGKQAVSARELHEFLEITTRFNDWFKRMVENYGFEEENDFVAITQKRVTAQGNETTFTEYVISLDMAKELSMVQRTERGKQARQYFIECEKELRSKQVPSTYAQALLEAGRLALELEESQVLLEAEKVKTEVLSVAVGESIEYISIKRVARWTRTHHSAYSWRKLKNESNYMEYEVKKEVDSNYGATNCYHIDVWKTVYPELSDVLDEECGNMGREVGIEQWR